MVDIFYSCDVYNPNNPLPIYKQTTTFSQPTVPVIEDPQNPLDLVAIQNLASLLPRESSTHFSTQMLPLLHRIGGKLSLLTLENSNRSIFRS